MVAWTIYLYSEEGIIQEMVELLHKARNTILCDNFITVNINTKHFALYLVFGSLISNTGKKKHECRRKMEAWRKKYPTSQKIKSQVNYLFSFTC